MEWPARQPTLFDASANKQPKGKQSSGEHDILSTISAKFQGSNNDQSIYCLDTALLELQKKSDLESEKRFKDGLKKRPSSIQKSESFFALIGKGELGKYIDSLVERGNTLNAYSKAAPMMSLNADSDLKREDPMSNDSNGYRSDLNS